MKIGLLIAGMIFFLNPGISIFDLLPDFIGALLFLRVTDRLTSVSPSAEEAGASFRNLVKTSLLRIAVLPVFAVVGRDETTFYLIFTMTFSCLEGYFLWRGLMTLYTAFGYLALRTGGKALGKTGVLSVQTTVFVLLRVLCNIIPDLAYLSVGEEGVITGSEFAGNRLLPYRNLLTAMNLIVVFAAGTVTLILWCRYLKRIGKETDTLPLLEEKIAEAVTEPGVLIRKTVKSAFLFLSLAGFAFLDFYADGTSLIPDFLAFFLLILGAARLKATEPFFRKVLPFASAGAVLSGAADLSAWLFYRKYGEAAMMLGISASEGKSWFTVNIGLKFLCVCFTVFAFAALRSGLNRLIDAHACMKTEKEFFRLSEKAERRRIRLKNLVTGCTVFSSVSKCLSLLDYATLFTPDPKITVSQKLTVTVTFWSISVLVGIAFAVFFRHTLDETREAIDERYQ